MMMAHKVIEYLRFGLENENVQKLYGFERGDPRYRYFSSVADNIESAMKFDLGAIDDLPHTVDFDLPKLPFNPSYFETENKGVKGSALLAYLEGDTIHSAVFADNSPTGIAGTTRVVDGRITTYLQWITGQAPRGSDENEQFNIKVTCNAILSSILLGIATMNCANVVTDIMPAPKNLNKKRAKKNKAPLFSYHVLKLKPRKEAGESLGGHHASPRIHLRRGHIRKCHSGITTWVQPCVVGNKEKGIVHKEYAVERMAN